MTLYKEPNNAYVVLMNGRHEIVWRTTGPVTELSVQALSAALNKDNAEQR